VKIRRYRPPVSLEAKPFRAVRRLHRNPTYITLQLGPLLNLFVLAILSVTASMSGICFGMCLRLAGL